MTLAHSHTDRVTNRPAAALVDAFDRLGVRMDYGRDEEIYGQGDRVELLYRVVSGVVRTSRLTCDGRRQVGDFYYPGDIFGLETGPEHCFAADALVECEVLAMRTSALRAAAGDQEVDRAILEATRRELERLQAHVMLLARRSARERVATFLVGQALRQDDEQVELPMGRQDMADYLGLTIETVSRMLTRLQDDSIVEFPTSRRFQVRRWGALEALTA